MGLTEFEYFEVIKEARKYVRGLKIRQEDELFEIMERGTQACFCHQDDIIYLREPSYYRSKQMLRHVLFHELGHWATREGRAGRVSKFKRKDFKKKHRSRGLHHHLNAALEEMIVDAVSFHFCKLSGYKVNARTHERYIEVWAKRGGLDKFWTDDLNDYYENKVKSLISFIKNYKNNHSN